MGTHSFAAYLQLQVVWVYAAMAHIGTNAVFQAALWIAA
ncbi:hypothetical protein L910_0427 [Vibrio fluvialis PG41]|uniref:Uncharacterized protein n=1 Tax=Vibrio fluvialis PG41 TaxID=1336752 RepID=S7JMD9_VIBFL|nr:hypothetical protein L910_0427 [Vibrio fluvialis PG41]